MPFRHCLKYARIYADELAVAQQRELSSVVREQRAYEILERLEVVFPLALRWHGGGLPSPVRIFVQLKRLTVTVSRSQIATKRFFCATDSPSIATTILTNAEQYSVVQQFAESEDRRSEALTIGRGGTEIATARLGLPSHLPPQRLVLLRLRRQHAPENVILIKPVLACPIL
jgi:hypothetical protein